MTAWQECLHEDLKIIRSGHLRRDVLAVVCPECGTQWHCESADHRQCQAVVVR